MDVMVIGGGPAGCAMAITLGQIAPELGVMLVEKSDYTGPRAGETIPPQCRVLLQRLGLWTAFMGEEHLPAYGAMAAWGSAEPYAHEFLYTPQREGWHLDRARFDAFLSRKAAESGAAVLQGAKFLSQEREGDVWRVTLEDAEGGRRVYRAGLVVDASGRKAVFAKALGQDAVRYDRLTGTMRILEAPALLDRSTLVEAFGDGWWYSALLPDGKMAVAVFSDAGIARDLRLSSPAGWASALEQAPFTCMRVKLSEGFEGAALNTWPAHSQRLLEPGGEGWLAVGDAAAAYDPLSSQGIFFALRSGMMGAYAVHDMLKGDARVALKKYFALQGDGFNEYLEQRQKHYVLEQRWPEARFWQRRFEQVKLSPRAVMRALPSEQLHPCRWRGAERRVRGEMGAVPAYQLAQRLMALRPDLDSTQAVLALQELVEDGFAEVEAERTLS